MGRNGTNGRPSVVIVRQTVRVVVAVEFDEGMCSVIGKDGSKPSRRELVQWLQRVIAQGLQQCRASKKDGPPR